MNGFITKYKQGEAGKILFEPMGQGFLRVEYDDEGLISQVAFVNNEGSEPKDYHPQIFFVWPLDKVVFKSKNSLGGKEWSSGGVYFGTVLETEGNNIVESDGKQTLEDWIGHCLEEMIVANTNTK